MTMVYQMDFFKPVIVYDLDGVESRLYSDGKNIKLLQKITEL